MHADVIEQFSRRYQQDGRQDESDVDKEKFVACRGAQSGRLGRRFGRELEKLSRREMEGGKSAECGEERWRRLGGNNSRRVVTIVTTARPLVAVPFFDHRNCPSVRLCPSIRLSPSLVSFFRLDCATAAPISRQESRVKIKGYHK